MPLALYSVYSTGEVRLRHFSLVLPWVMLATALGLAELAAVARRSQTWGDWNNLLAKWQANRKIAGQLRVYDLTEIARSAT